MKTSTDRNTACKNVKAVCLAIWWLLAVAVLPAMLAFALLAR
jgi:hypothetical protein